MKSAIQTAVLATVLLLAVISLPVVAAPGSNSLFIAGSAFTPRTSAQTVTYPGAGCSYSDKAMTTSVNLPAGSSVTGVRVYYYNQDPSSTLGTFFTSYNGLGGF